MHLGKERCKQVKFTNHSKIVSLFKVYKTTEYRSIEFSFVKIIWCCIIALLCTTVSIQKSIICEYIYICNTI